MGECMEKAYVKQRYKGELLFHRGDEERALYKVLSGSLSSYSGYGIK